MHMPDVINYIDKSFIIYILPFLHESMTKVQETPTCCLLLYSVRTTTIGHVEFAKLIIHKYTFKQYKKRYYHD